ncbi:MAG TPA: 2-C-methyl-D-erythritol 4-phosphate cytidylyltransferase [Gammaproteobacteria bacterium]|nr:2-C-methyl-D-erythritol 4-phosphate cytidylyltransferase [Gammaproteobacteria bacterium]
MTRAWAVVPAAGSGRRMGSAVAKQYLPLLGRPLLAHALAPLLASERLDAVVLCVAPEDRAWREAAGDDSGVHAHGEAGQRLLIATGGEERCHSVLNGLQRLADRAAEDDWVLVHDAARPCLSDAELKSLFSALADDPVGGLLAMPLSDTLKAADETQRVLRTLPRDGLWRALTPQMFRYGLLREALADAVAAGLAVTDEAAAMERAGHRPALVAGSAANIKVTTPEDLALAEAVLRQREGRECA